MAKVAVVTGGSSGIGAATARLLSGRGWQVAVVARKGVEFQADVAKDADCRRVAKAVLDQWGRIDALVNNAGTTKFVKHADLEGLAAADYERIFGINLVGPFQMVRACADALKAARGAVVNVSSVASLRGTGSSIAYAASKAALNTMTQSLARALAPEVRVNAVLPGFVRTPWQDLNGKEAGDAAERSFAAAAPLKRAIPEGDVAEAIAFLIDGARSTTGETLLVDAGVHLATGR
ncbi:MAG TPA: SDR family oxidoreductase [Burkholderiales bacterium]|nr:SDR family oxidoreductase [Burkholderiales bacterium]